MLERTATRSTILTAILAFFVISAMGFYADRQYSEIARRAMQASLREQAQQVRDRVEVNFNHALRALQGLQAIIETQPSLDKEQFDRLASRLVERQSLVRSVTVAPDFVVTMVYPEAKNEKVIGLKYLDDPQQRAMVELAKNSEKCVVSGPVHLVQGGGTAFIAYFPVFSDEAGSNRFWGILAGAIDTETIYRESGLRDPHLPIEVAIANVDGIPFFDSRQDQASAAIKLPLDLPTQGWSLIVAPKAELQRIPVSYPLRAATILAAALVALAILSTGRLNQERRNHLRVVNKHEAERRELAHRLETALEASEIGAWEYDLDTGKLTWDERTKAQYGLKGDQQPDYSQWAQKVHPDDIARVEADLRKSLEDDSGYTSQFRILQPDGSFRHQRARAKTYFGDNGSRKMVGTSWDVTEDVELNQALEDANELAQARYDALMKANARLEHTSLHDSLTGLPNRHYLDKVLDDPGRTGAEPNQDLALLHVDLDRFNQINDTLGHAAGDAVLRHVARLLEETTRDGDFIARVGGDEFVVFCTSDCGDEQMAELAERIVTATRQPFLFQGHNCRYGVSIGIASERGKPADSKHLLINADIALNRAKRRGRNRYEFFTRELQEQTVETKSLADEILNGLENNEFVAHYQPQFDALTLRIVSVEALVRWHHPDKGILSPEIFLPVAEELSVVSSIDKAILEQAIQHHRAWAAASIDIPRIAVNVSARRLNEEDLIARLRDLPIEPGTISFELVESIFLDETDEIVVSNVNQIKEMEIDIEIDDFGTGHASIVSLLKLKPKRLKIDRQLVAPIVECGVRRKLVGSIIGIGKSLGIEVIAEGVESMEQAQILRDLGCDVLQGYAFSKAMTELELREFLSRRSA